MKNNEESSFLQGVESRLDSLFAEGTPKIAEKDSKPSQATVQNVAPDIKEDIPEIQNVKEPEIKTEPSPEPIQATDKSQFISEIEKRFSAIFGEEEKKDVFAAREVEKPSEITDKIKGAGLEEKVLLAEPLESIAPPPPPPPELHSPLDDLSPLPSSEFHSALDDLSSPTSIYNSPLKDMKSVILSTDKMPEAKKHTILLDDIKRYRTWVDSTDLHEFEAAEEAKEVKEVKIPEAVAEGVKPSEGKPLPEEKTLIEKKEEIKPVAIEPPQVEPVPVAAVAPPVVEETVPQFMAEQAVKEEKETLKIEGFEPVKEEPVSEAPIVAAVVEESFQQETRPEAQPEKAIKEPGIAVVPEPAPMAISPFGYSKKMEGLIAAIKDQPTQEAFSCALEEIKNMLQSELDALKEEIRSLKNAQ
ncbi:MAG: hypothetical protein CVU51_13490 [Deltaproteobacteria bacterium HGW-Deltaproteobacteria-1]|nr:MAG: hypothetical protein CVU51_13490 [Deltaproteobacteria bacterium HGW-Deltaproteobacteria-1]